MSGSYFGFSPTASHFSQNQQGQGTYGATHFTPAAAATPHTSYVVASTARPSAAYETTYTAQPASQYYTATPQRQETHHQASTPAYRTPTAYTTYTAESTASYDKQAYYQQHQAAAAQPQQSSQAATYYTGTAAAGTSRAGQGSGKSTYTAYYQSGGNQPKSTGKSGYTSYYQSSGSQQKASAAAKPAASYQSPAASFNQSKPSQSKQSSGGYQQQSYSTGGGSYSSGYGGSTSGPSKKHTSYSGGGQQHHSGGNSGTNDGYSYDAVVFSAASNFYQQQQRPPTGGGGSSGHMKKPVNGQGAAYKGPPRNQRQPPKPSQLHYCAVCKISCAGPLTYKEHLEGQKHKKKEEAAKNTSPTVIKSSQPSYRCELCDVTCTGMDAYNAHIRGKNHNKVFNLHTRLGKPIPSTDPVKLNAGASSTAQDKAGPSAKKPVIGAKKPVTPKINFVEGSKFSSVPAEKPTEDVKPAEVKPEEQEGTTAEDKDNDCSNIQPVGEDYVEEIRNEEGKLVSFNCKLCECRFNDPHAKNMHMKGRRHRLQYKSKVDPSLKVEAKPTQRNRRLLEDKMRRKMAKEEMMRRQDEEMKWRDQMRQYDEEMLWRMMEEERYQEGMRHHEEMFHEWMRRGGPHSGLPPPPRAPPIELPTKKQETEIDRHVMAKHNSVYPKEPQLQAVQTMVSTIERALKQVSDFLTDAEKPVVKTDTKAEVKVEPETATAESKKAEGAEKDTNIEQKYRVMKGVMRVGVLAKGLLLADDMNMDLIVLCSEKPTRTLLERVFHCMPKQLTEITEDKYDVSLCVEEAAILLAATINECPMKMKVSLTSPVMRDPPAAEAADASRDPPDVLDKEKCLAALAALRHAKWFQAKAAVLSSCVVVIRILRDLCDRIPTWAPLKGWPVELICERVIDSAGRPLSPGDALRRVFEAVAGGLLLPGGPGIYDPCEREEIDVMDAMTPQQKEEITASAQHALRLIVFRQAHKVLNMEPLFSQRRRFFNRKRRREDGENKTPGEADGKKDKKEEPAATSGGTTPEGK